MCDCARCNLTLLHGLQQGRLSARCRPVNFVRQKNLAKNRALGKMKRALAAVVDIQNLATGDVARHREGGAELFSRIGAEDESRGRVRSPLARRQGAGRAREQE